MICTSIVAMLTFLYVLMLRIFFKILCSFGVNQQFIFFRKTENILSILLAFGGLTNIICQ